MKNRHVMRSWRMAEEKGFTLVELIMAMTVLAVALSGLVSLYGISLDLASEARQKTVAAESAETHLAALIATPEAFVWHIDRSHETVLFPITLGVDDPVAGNPVSPPDVLLVNRNVHARNESTFKGIRWKAWGRLPSPDSEAYEVTVSVHWRSRGKHRSLALTSSVPRHMAPEATGEGEAAL